MEEWQIQSASSIISKAFEIKEYAIAPKAVRYEIASGNLREDFPSIVRKLEAMDMGASAEYLNGGLVILVYDARVKKGGWTSSVHIDDKETDCRGVYFCWMHWGVFCIRISFDII